MQQTRQIRYFLTSFLPGALALCVAVSGVFSGCMSTGRTISDKVSEPPDVPVAAIAGPGDALSDPLLSDQSELGSFELFTYGDIEKLPNIGAHNRLLKEAVEYAIDQGILRKPAWAGRMVDAVIEDRLNKEQPTENPKENVVATTADDAPPVVVEAKPSKPILFEPDRAVSYGDFYKWHERFRMALAEAEKPAPKPEDENAKTDDKDTAPAEAPAPEPVKLPPGPLKADMESHGEHFSEKSGLTRQQLCLLLVLVTNRDEELSEFNAEAVAAMAPEGAGPNETLEQFRDFQTIDPDLRRYVGYAYQSGVLSRLYGLSPEALTETAGFNPKKAVSRGEALMLLYSVMKKP